MANRYGWHRDELYFLEAGRNLAWGYVDQPPFTPFVARLADQIAPRNLVVLRLLPALATAATITFGALIVRELGGDRRAQVLGAGAMAAGGFALGAGHLLSTAVFDLTAWMALLWIAARLLRTGDTRWWLVFGGVAGVALLNKNLVVLLAVSLLSGLVVGRRWDLLRTPWLPAGAALAGLVALPHLLWQVDNGWPQFEMAEALSERLAGENRATMFPLQLLFAGPLLVGAIWKGARWLAPDRRFRPLLWAWPAAIALALLAGGRPYYVLPLTLTVLLAGVVAGVRWLPWLIAANGLVSIPLSLPVLPVSSAKVTGAVNETVAETVGWPELVEQVAGVVDGIDGPVVLLAGSYGEAGAIDRFGANHGLPPAHSPHNSYADFRRPTDDDATVVAVRFPARRLAPEFERCEQVATVDNRLDVDNEVQGTPILVCEGLRRPWAEVWEDLRFLS